MTVLTLNERDASREYGIPVRTLQGWRMRGGGPEYIKCGRSVRYRRDSIERWLDSRTCRNTSEAGNKEANR
jgi:hypothetical protein